MTSHGSWEIKCYNAMVSILAEAKPDQEVPK